MSSEKRKTNVENDLHFLEKCGANISMRNLLLELSELQPEDPLSYIYDYFNCFREKIDNITKAERFLKHSSYDKPCFQRKLQQAFDCLAQNNSTDKMSCITGKAMMEFLNSYTNKLLSQEVQSVFLKKIHFKPHEAVPIHVFSSTVVLICILKDFVEVSCHLYDDVLVKNNADAVDAVACNTIVQLLKEAFKKTLINNNLNGLLEALQTLSLDQLHSTITTAQFKNSSTNQTTSREAFIRSLSELFLQNIKIST